MHIGLKEKVLEPVGEGEVMVDIHAAGLNFRDVLMSLNMLPEAAMSYSNFGPHMVSGRTQLRESH